MPTWSRDGRFIYFHSDRNGLSQVWKMRADGSEPRPITTGGGYVAHESHDRAAIFYSKNRCRRQPVDRRNRRRQRAVLVPTDLPTQRRPRPVRCLLLHRTRSGRGPGDSLLPDSTNQTTRTVLRLPRPVGLGISLAPDESWLLFLNPTVLVLT